MTSRRVSVAVACFAVASATTACGGGGSGKATAYPTSVKTSVIAGLQSEGQTQQVASCMLGWYESHLSYQQFKTEFPNFQGNSAKALSDTNAAHASCVSSSGSSGNASASDTTNSGTTDTLTTFCNDRSTLIGDVVNLVSGSQGGGTQVSASALSDAASLAQRLANEAPAGDEQDAEAVASDLNSSSPDLVQDQTKLSLMSGSCTSRSDTSDSPTTSDVGVSPGVTCPTDSAGNCIGNSP